MRDKIIPFLFGLLLSIRTDLPIDYIIYIVDPFSSLKTIKSVDFKLTPTLMEFTEQINYILSY